MNHWCTGELKVRGTKESILEFIMRELKESNHTQEPLIESHDGVMYEVVPTQSYQSTFHVSESDDSFLEVPAPIELWGRLDDVCATHLGYFSSPYELEVETLQHHSGKYGLDFWINAFSPDETQQHQVEVRQGEVIRDDLVRY